MHIIVGNMSDANKSNLLTYLLILWIVGNVVWTSKKDVVNLCGSYFAIVVFSFNDLNFKMLLHFTLNLSEYYFVQCMRWHL